MFTYPIGFYGGGAEPPEITYLGDSFGSLSINVGIGDDRPDRIIVFASQYELDGSTAITHSYSLGTPSYVYRPTINDPIALSYAVIPTGSSLTLTSSGTATRMKLAVWKITGANTLDSTLTGVIAGSTANLNGTSPSTPSAIIGVSRSRGAQLATSATVSGTFEDPSLDYAYSSGGGQSNMSGASCYANSAGAGTLSINTNASFTSGIAGGGIFTLT